jgi:hypothetical protein
MAATAAKLRLLTELGEVLGCKDTCTGLNNGTETPARRALPAHLYYDGPFEPRPPRRPHVSLERPSTLEQERRALVALGEWRLMRFILSRRRTA